MRKLFFWVIVGLIAFGYYDGTFTVQGTLRNFQRVKSYVDSHTDTSVASTSAPVNTGFEQIEIPFYYDSSNAPADVQTGAVLDAVKHASNVWTEACGVSFKYLGKRYGDYASHNTTNAGFIRWGELDGDAIGEATLGSVQGPAFNFVMTLSRSSFESSQHNFVLFHPTILHELGHVIALDHSNNPSSIMYWQMGHDTPLMGVLNESDKAICRYYRYRWAGLSNQQASDKAGVIANRD